MINMQFKQNSLILMLFLSKLFKDVTIKKLTLNINQFYRIKTLFVFVRYECECADFIQCHR